MVTGVSLHPTLVIVGTLAENLLAHHRNAENLANKMNHLLRPGEPVQVAVDDNPVKAVIYKNEKIAKQLSEPFHRTFTLPGLDRHGGTENDQTGHRQKSGGGQGFRLADEIDYIQCRAAEHDGRFVTVGPLILLSTDTGDAWLLDPAEHLAARLARDGDPEPIYFEETATNFAIGWKGSYRIESDAFIYSDRESGRIITILGYPTRRLARLG